jgi:hypothetical protein
MDVLFRDGAKLRDTIENALESVTPTGETEDVDVIRNWFYDFFHEYLPYHYLNADYRKDLEAYHHIFNPAGRILMNADDRIKYAQRINMYMYFNHDKNIELYDDNTPPWDKEMHKWVIVLDDSISVPEEEYRQNGYYADPEYNHVYDKPFKFVPESMENTDDAENSVLHDGTQPSHHNDKLYSKDIDVERYKS